MLSYKSNYGIHFVQVLFNYSEVKFELSSASKMVSFELRRETTY